MCNALKKKIGYYSIWRNRRHQRRKKKVFNLKTAKSIGILFDATARDHFDAVREFYQRLKNGNRKIQILGFVNSKEIPPNYLFIKDFVFFTRKMLNWYGKPVNPDVTEFIKYPFDILINLTTTSRFVFDYITGSSPARFKVGRYREKHIYADMMIHLDETTTPEYFIELVTDYLETINRPELSSNYLNL